MENWMLGIQNALGYIEENLTGDLEVRERSKGSLVQRELSFCA